MHSLPGHCLKLMVRDTQVSHQPLHLLLSVCQTFHCAWLSCMPNARDPPTVYANPVLISLCLVVLLAQCMRPSHCVCQPCPNFPFFPLCALPAFVLVLCVCVPTPYLPLSLQGIREGISDSMLQYKRNDLGAMVGGAPCCSTSAMTWVQ